jgi:hypothetical protein
MSKRLFLVLCLLLLALPMAAHAQVPDSINRVLADLSERVGTPVTLDNTDLTWTFEQKIFPDASLECPQPGQNYIQTQTRGTQYIMTYKGVVYDYRVSDDGSVFILCNEEEVKPACPPPDVAGYLPPRLFVGGFGKVGPGGVSNNVRELPGSSSRLLGEIPSEAQFIVLDGPSCSTLDKVVWWKVDYNGLVGWTAESKDGEYYLDPLVLPGTLVPTAPPLPTATPSATAQVIKATNATQVALLGTHQSDMQVYALSLDGQILVVGRQDGTITLVDVQTNVPSAPVAAHTGFVTAILYAADTPGLRQLLITGGAEGFVHIWEVGDGNSLTRVASTQVVENTASISALAYSPVSQLIATGDSRAEVKLYDLTGALLATFPGADSPIESVEFSADGRTLLVISVAGAAYVWGIPTSAG